MNTSKIIERESVQNRINAIGVNYPRIIERELPDAKPLAGASQVCAARVEFWLNSGERLEIEPLLSDGYDSYQVDSFTANHRHVGSSKVHQSVLHTALYVEALNQIKEGL